MLYINLLQRLAYFPVLQSSFVPGACTCAGWTFRKKAVAYAPTLAIPGCEDCVPPYITLPKYQPSPFVRTQSNTYTRYRSSRPADVFDDHLLYNKGRVQSSEPRNFFSMSGLLISIFWHILKRKPLEKQNIDIST